MTRERCSVLRSVFGLDLRSLAAFRVGVSLVVLFDLWNRSSDLVAHYTDQGVLPRALWGATYGTSDGSGRDYWWSLHLFSGDPLFQAALVIIAVLFAMLMMVGYWTRLSTVITWVLLVSLQTRNPLVNDGGDVLLRNLLFWSMFLPLGGRASIDARLRPRGGEGGGTVLSVAGVALLLQIVMPYWMSAVLKTHPVWTTECSALYYALNIDAFATSFGRSLLDYPSLLCVLTFSTYWFELVGPFFAFSPVKTAWFRVLAVSGFWVFHVGLVLMMELGLFPFIAMAAWTAFLPSRFWDTVSSAFRKPLYAPGDGRESVPAEGAATGDVGSPGHRTRLSRLAFNGVLLVLLIYMIAWNLRELNPKHPAARLFPTSWNVLGRMTGINQDWFLFAPYPLRNDGWYEIKGVLNDGSEVNLFEVGQELPVEKPSLVSETYVNQRWRKFLLNMVRGDVHRPELLEMCKWLRWRWDTQHAPHDSEKRVKEVWVIFWLEETPPPGEDFADPKPYLRAAVGTTARPSPQDDQNP